MDTTGQVLALYWMSVVAVGVGGVAGGLFIYHSCLGWFISRHSIQSLDNVIEDARRHKTRQTERRHRRERRRRVEVEAGLRPAGRHLAR